MVIVHSFLYVYQRIYNTLLLLDGLAVEIGFLTQFPQKKTLKRKLSHCFFMFHVDAHVTDDFYIPAAHWVS